MAKFLDRLFRRLFKGAAPAPVPAPPKAKPHAPARPHAPAKPYPAAVAKPHPAPATPPPGTIRHLPKPTGGRHFEYAPKPDGDADPGEIIWTWVPYEEDHTQGKDRPVLIVGRDGREVYGLMLSSQSERDGQHNWMALGPGDWDREKRPSWVRLDRVLGMPDDSIRREGAVLDGMRFARVAAVLKKNYGWN